MALVVASVADALAQMYPQPLLFVVAADGNGHVDIQSAGYLMPASLRPPRLAVALGVRNYTRELIEASHEFVLAFAAAGQAERITFCGTHSGRALDKFAAAHIPLQPGRRVAAPVPADASLAFECRVADSLLAGDHVIYVADLLAGYIAEPEQAPMVNFGGWYSAAEPTEPRR